MLAARDDRRLSRRVKRAHLVRAAWIAGGIVFVLFLLRTFVGDVYHVDSGSMEPTLWGDEGGGEYVFVRFDRSKPARQELVVVKRRGGENAVVKRVAGLPEESIRILQGDLLVDRTRLRPSEPRASAVTLFDDRWHRVEDRFVIFDEQKEIWTHAGNEWRLDAREVPLGADRALLFLRDPVNDDYLGPEHELVKGSVEANDLRIECEVRCDDPTGRARLRVTELMDVFEAHLARADQETVELAITRQNRADQVETLATARFPLPLGRWTRFWLENRDNALRVGFDGPGSPLVAVYKDNVPSAGEGRDPERTYGYRAAFGGEGGRFAFRAIRLARDLVYTPEGRIGTQTDVLLGPGQYFLLGDHSSKSRDSRDWGPVDAGDLVGRPVAVVWPPSRWRRLQNGRLD